MAAASTRPPTGTLTLTDCTVSDNATSVNGGGVSTSDPATFTRVTFSDNFAGFGGGLAVTGGISSLIDAIFNDNSAGIGGGGLSNTGGAATQSGGSFEGNSAWMGGGIYSGGGTTGLDQVTVSGNSAADNGGGLFNNKGAINVHKSTVSKNMAATGGPDAQGSITSQGGNAIGDTDAGKAPVGPDMDLLALSFKSCSGFADHRLRNVPDHVDRAISPPAWIIRTAGRPSRSPSILGHPDRQQWTIGAGNFTTIFATASLGVAGGPYTVTYAFAGAAGLTASTDTKHVRDGHYKADATVVVTPGASTYTGTAHTAIVMSITGVDGESAPLSAPGRSEQHGAHGRRHLRHRHLELQQRQLQRHCQHGYHRRHQQGERDGRGHAVHRELRQ